MSRLARIWHSAIWEWQGALRSRRALVILLLYLVSAILCMYGAVSVLGKMEKELVEVLQLPSSGTTGVVSQTLWKSKPFVRIVRSAVGAGPVLDGIFGRHPVELLYAWFVFLCAPLLAVLVCGTRVADDLRSGAVRYMLVRTTRLEWSLSKFAGQSLMIALALLASSIGSATLAFCVLPADVAGGIFVPMLGWGAKAWVYSLSWIGLALGLSHLTSSPGRATALGIFAVFFCTVFSPLVDFLHVHFSWADEILILKMLVPQSAKASLWRSDAVPFAVGSFHLLVLGLFFLSVGILRFSRRDV